jgi:WD40 repeat protein
MSYGPHAVLSGQYLDERQGHVNAGAISPDGHLVLLGHASGMLRLCDVPASAEVRRFEIDVPLFTADITRDGRYLLTGSMTGGVAILWDAATGQEIRRFSFPEDAVFVKFSPDGRSAVLGSGDSWGTSGAFGAALVDLESGQEVFRLNGYEFPLRSMAFSPDGRYLLAGTLAWGAAWPETGAGELLMWDVASGTIVRRFAETRAVMDVAFSPDGRRAVTTSSEFADYISVWDVATGQLIRRFSHVPEIQFPQGVVWEPDGNRIIVGGTGSIGEMDVETGKVMRVFRGLKCNTFFVDHSPDWHYLVGGDNCTPSTLMIWDLATGEEIEHFTAYNAPIWNVLFNPNGQTVFTSSLGEKPVIEWQVIDWPLDRLVAWIYDNRYIRDFTCEERAQYRIGPLCNGEAQ